MTQQSQPKFHSESLLYNFLQLSSPLPINTELCTFNYTHVRALYSHCILYFNLGKYLLAMHALLYNASDGVQTSTIHHRTHSLLGFHSGYSWVSCADCSHHWSLGL